MSVILEITGRDGAVKTVGPFPCHAKAEEWKREWLRHRPNKLATQRAEVLPVPGTEHGPEVGYDGPVLWECGQDYDPLTGARFLQLNGKRYEVRAAPGRVELTTEDGELYTVSLRSCTCQFWLFVAGPKGKVCKHIFSLQQLGLLPRAERLSVFRGVTAGGSA